MPIKFLPGIALLGTISGLAGAEEPSPLPQLEAYQVPESWLQPVPPLKIGDNTWQIGTEAITSLLLKDPAGAILIDGGMVQTADHLLGNLKALGLQPSDLKLILHSHAHADHVGSLAALQRATGAQVVTNAESAILLASGGADDIHFGDSLLYPPVQADRILHHGELVTLGKLRLQVHFIPGHTPGSMAWTWQDKVDGKTTNIAYVDSLSAPDYQLVDNPRYPDIVQDYGLSFERVGQLPCDLLITPHAGASGWHYRARAVQEKPTDCRAYADRAQKKLERQISAQKVTQSARGHAGP
ncbi:subclass B3 metallo-beta-lactamase [Microbulbifer discodermiae]|uniref:subclass B3 metallo-beta-lactamase n=1 Tax=Microbulbifer sp. 2201CG32-9 TaxID=3232309 RepID=UPI00345BA22A